MAAIATGNIIHMVTQTRVRGLRFNRENSTRTNRVFDITTADNKTHTYMARVPNHGTAVMIDCLFLELGRTLTPTRDLWRTALDLFDVLHFHLMRDDLDQALEAELEQINEIFARTYSTLHKASALKLDRFKVQAEPALRPRKLELLNTAKTYFYMAADALEDFVNMFEYAESTAHLHTMAQTRRRFGMWVRAFELELFI